MSEWVTADHHFGHANIRIYEDRPPDWMNTAIERWNEVVSPDDIVYHLGDFAFASLEYARYILSCLNGEKHLVLGNHDNNRARMMDMGFSIVYGSRKAGTNEDSKEYGLCLPLRVDGTTPVLSHRPLSHRWWIEHIEGIFPEPVNYHGHVHSNPYGSMPYHINVSVDVTDYYPQSLGEGETWE
jgi:calcineurin-like phosphoesterase family protein